MTSTINLWNKYTRFAVPTISSLALAKGISDAAQDKKQKIKKTTLEAAAAMAIPTIGILGYDRFIHGPTKKPLLALGFPIAYALGGAAVAAPVYTTAYYGHKLIRGLHEKFKQNTTPTSPVS